MHPTWVATQSLRDRNFEFMRPGNQKWSEKIVKIIRAAEFATVQYKIKCAVQFNHMRSGAVAWFLGVFSAITAFLSIGIGKREDDFTAPLGTVFSFDVRQPI